MISLSLDELKLVAKNRGIKDYKKPQQTVCSYHVTYAFHSESTLYICLNVKELLARNKCDI